MNYYSMLRMKIKLFLTENHLRLVTSGPNITSLKTEEDTDVLTGVRLLSNVMTKMNVRILTMNVIPE